MSAAVESSQAFESRIATRTAENVAIRREIIARGAVAGLSDEQIAAAVGLTRHGVDSAKRHPETRALIARLLQKHNEEIEAGFAETLQSARDDIKHDNWMARASGRSAVLQVVKLSESLELQANQHEHERESQDNAREALQVIAEQFGLSISAAVSLARSHAPSLVEGIEWVEGEIDEIPNETGEK